MSLESKTLNLQDLYIDSFGEIEVNVNAPLDFSRDSPGVAGYHNVPILSANGSGCVRRSPRFLTNHGKACTSRTILETPMLPKSTSRKRKRSACSVEESRKSDTKIVPGACNLAVKKWPCVGLPKHSHGVHDPEFGRLTNQHDHSKFIVEPKLKPSHIGTVDEYRILKPLEPWSFFHYNRYGELYESFEFDEDSLRHYITCHPLGKALVFWIQRQPSKRFQFTDATNRCRLRSCPTPNSISIGHFRIAFDEASGRSEGQEAHPFLYAGVMHIGCFENAFDLPALTANFDVRVDERCYSRSVKMGEPYPFTLERGRIRSAAFIWLNHCYANPNWRPSHIDETLEVVLRSARDYRRKARGRLQWKNGCLKRDHPAKYPDEPQPGSYTPPLRAYSSEYMELSGWGGKRKKGEKVDDAEMRERILASKALSFKRAMLARVQTSSAAPDKPIMWAPKAFRNTPTKPVKQVGKYHQNSSVLKQYGKQNTTESYKKRYQGHFSSPIPSPAFNQTVISASRLQLQSASHSKLSSHSLPDFQGHETHVYPMHSPNSDAMHPDGSFGDQSLIDPVLLDCNDQASGSDEFQFTQPFGENFDPELALMRIFKLPGPEQETSALCVPDSKSFFSKDAVEEIESLTLQKSYDRRDTELAQLKQVENETSIEIDPTLDFHQTTYEFMTDTEFASLLQGETFSALRSAPTVLEGVSLTKKMKE